MKYLTITEDFSKIEIEFDQRFSESTVCYGYLFKQKWPNGFICKKLAISNSYCRGWALIAISKKSLDITS